MLGPSPYPLFDRYPFGPVVDGDALPLQPFDPDAPDFMRDVPLIIGDMKDETASFLAPDDLVWHRTLTEAQLVDRVHAIAGADTERVVETYRRLYPGATPADRLIATTTDCNFRIRSLVLAQRRAAKATAPVWMYAFAESLGLTGFEVFDIEGIAGGIKPGMIVNIRARSATHEKALQAVVRIDTPYEIQYYQHGGILQYVLRQLIG